jgi:type IV pilus assembly protein PilV
MNQAGFTLIEVLVAVVIFAVGLLGLAGLQATGLKLNHSSMLRSQATLLGYDVLDAMRANRDTSAAYAIDMDDGRYSDPAAQAQRDVNSWLSSLETLLPEGDGSIALAGGRATITVQWDDSRGKNDMKTLTLVSDI